MRTSTVIILVGIALFLLPIPVTFISGALVVVAGVLYRLFAE